MLDDNQAKGIVIYYLSVQLKNQAGKCLGFVVMPEHVHALVHFKEQGQLSIFMSQWKRRSSIELKRLYRNELRFYGERIDVNGPMWQAKYYVFNVFTEIKIREKLDYMHNNPVKAGLVENSVDWPYSSARWYFLRKAVGVDIEPVL